MNKKKLIAMITCLMLIAAIAVGGTLAYFMDDENATNVFTIGNVEIDLVEEQRDENGKWVEFENNKLLMPVIGSVQGQAVDENGISLAKNYVDKIVTVDNEGTEPAYVRVLMAFPAKMDDADAATDMLLHWNHSRYEEEDYWTRAETGVTIELDGEYYNVYSMTYEKILQPRETTKWPAITGVYVDSTVDAEYTDANGNADENGDYITYFKTKKTDGKVKKATYRIGQTPKIYVIAQGIQSAGFADLGIKAAGALEYEGAFGQVTEDNARTWFNEAYAFDAEGNFIDEKDHREDIVR